MSDELLKVTEDLWCLWSNIADGPKVWGTKDQVRAHMMMGERPCPCCGWSPIDDRFERAEARGTSMRDAQGPPKGFTSTTSKAGCRGSAWKPSCAASALPQR